MSIGKPAIPFTYEDYQSLPESRDLYELMDGELHVTPPPTTTHQIVSKNIHFALEHHVRETDAGLVLSAPVAVVLGEAAQRSVVQPDLLFVSRSRESVITDAEIVGAPDLVIEILSASTEQRDRGLKSTLYARAGVREYWIVDARAEAIEVFTLGADAYGTPVRYAREATLTSGVLAGLRLRLVDVFRRR